MIGATELCATAIVTVVPCAVIVPEAVAATIAPGVDPPSLGRL